MQPLATITSIDETAARAAAWEVAPAPYICVRLISVVVDLLITSIEEAAMEPAR
jgi:hypothetical protein